jgi:hypothetical protein
MNHVRLRNRDELTIGLREEIGQACAASRNRHAALDADAVIEQDYDLLDGKVRAAERRVGAF